MVGYPAGTDEYSLVDGQQRLTTVVLALCAIRDAFVAIDEKASAKALTKVLVHKDLDGNRRFVLKAPAAGAVLPAIMSPDAHDLPTPADKTQKAYLDAHTTIKGLLASSLASVGDEEPAVRDLLVDLRERFLDLWVVWVQPPDEDSAQMVFETLNSRGKDLEAVDLLKNLLLRIARPKYPDYNPMRDHWASLRTKFDRTPIAPFIHHWWISEQKYEAQNKLFGAMRKFFKSSKLDADGAVELAAKLDRLADYYIWVADPDSWQPVQKERATLRRTLRAVRDFDVKQPRPLLFAILRALEEKRMPIATAIQMFDAIEAFHFVSTNVAGISSSGGISKMYARLAIGVTDAKSNQQAKILTDLKRSLAKSKTRASYEVFASSLDSAVRYATESAREQRILRYTLERSHLLATTGSVDLGVCTIEHIASRSAGPEWVDKLGNLVLVPEGLNGKLEKKDFAAKKRILAAHPISKDLDVAYILEQDKWDEAAVAGRLEVIARRIYDWFESTIT
jgi:hypothetical protein